MRIGIVTGEYPPMQGGVGAFSQILARTLVEQGHQVRVFSTQKSAEPDSRIPLNHSLRRWGLFSLWAVRDWAQSQELDIVNLQFETAAFQMSPYIHFLPDVLRPFPVVTTFHDLLVPYLFPKAGAVRDWIVQRLARASSGVIATNHEDFARLATHPCSVMIPIGSNIMTPENNVDAGSWATERGLDLDRLLVFFGFLNHSKGAITLLQALAKLRDRGQRFTLVIVGDRTGTSDTSNASYARTVDQYIADLSLNEQVRWTGFVPEAEVSRYLWSARAVVLPFVDGASFRRGTLMAAIQHGCRIVTTTPRVSIPEFVDRVNMVLAPPEDSDALAAAILEAVQSTTLQQEVLTLRRRFDWGQIAADTLAFWGQVIDG